MKITKKLQYADVINGKRVTFYGNSPEELASQVLRIRKKNGVDSDFNSVYQMIKKSTGDVEQVDGVDSKIFKKRVNGQSRNQPTRSRSVSIQDAAKAATALIKIIPGDYVSQEEYQRRAKICATCPLRQRNSDCMGCGGSGRAARMLMSFRSKLGLGYKVDEKIARQFCGFCGCSLSLLMLTKIKNYKTEDEETNSSRPSHCWLRRNSQNYVG